MGGFLAECLGVSQSGAAVLLLGMLAGFPIGASAAAELYREGGCDSREAQRLMPLSNHPSPAFVLAAGGTVFHSRTTALLLLTALYTATIWLVAMSGRKPPRSRRDGKENPEKTTVSLVSCFAGACVSAGRSMLLICAYVVFFGVITGFLPENPLLRGIFEMTGGIYALSGQSGKTAVCAAFLLGFGGLCVAAQSMCFAEEAGLSMKRYLKLKLCQGTIAAVHMFAMIKLRYWAILLAFAEIGIVAVKNSGKKSENVLYSE